MDGHWWKKVNFPLKTNVWYGGELYPGKGMANYEADGTCTGDADLYECRQCDDNFPTGDFILSGDPSQLLAEHIIQNFVNDTVFLKDALEGKSFTAAKSSTPKYYQDLQNWITYLSHVAVSANTMEGATKQNLIMAQSG